MTVGGRIVYSTCSFNPVEDEAVVTAVLKLMNGKSICTLLAILCTLPDVLQLMNGKSICTLVAVLFTLRCTLVAVLSLWSSSCTVFVL